MENNNYTKYHSTSGMSTKHWGPSAWNFLFISILGRYPIKIDFNNKEDLKIKESFYSLFMSLPIILPCIFCRNSFDKFIKELPIDDYLVGRIELFYWLYLMKDKVNKKLLKQEQEAYEEQKYKLKQLYNKGIISSKKYKKKLKKCKKESFNTIPSPPFKDVLDYYESFRANCSTKAKTCSIKIK